MPGWLWPAVKLILPHVGDIVAVAKPRFRKRASEAAGEPAVQQQIAEQQAENEQLLERNRILEAEVLELKQSTETVEERARHELGMVKEGETLYQLAE